MTPLASMTPTLPGPLLSHDPWAAEADSDGCDLFSPVSSRTSQQFHTTGDLPTPNHLKSSSWSGNSSTSLSPASTISDPLPTMTTTTQRTKPPKHQPRARKHSIQLRTAARKPRKPPSPTTITTTATTANRPPPALNTSEEDDLTPEERRARRNHNIVEKQYRNRLNAQFERLLAVLPVDRCSSGSGVGGGPVGQGVVMPVGGGGDGEEKRMSKAEVLELATVRIRTLEAERGRLKRERRELVRGLEVLMVGGGGVGGVRVGC